LIAFAGDLITCLIYIIIISFKNTSLNLIYVGIIIQGATGSLSLIEVVAYAYASDLTINEERTVVFGRIRAGSYAGIALGYL
jgi:MFS family permease